MPETVPSESRVFSSPSQLSCSRCDAKEEEKCIGLKGSEDFHDERKNAMDFWNQFFHELAPLGFEDVLSKMKEEPK